MRPRKRFGQHFLHDRGVIERLLAAIEPRAGEHFVEIGPGRGALTLPLLARGVRIDAVEVDRDLAGALEQGGHGPALAIHRADALRFDFRALASGPSSLRLAANLPYNISTPLLFHLLGHSDVFRDLHVMLQREVVERMVAQPDTADYGRLTVALAVRCRVEKLFLVKPGAFQPPPKVDSAIARLVPEPGRLGPIVNAARFDALLTRAFSMRRKRLSNALSGLLSAGAIADAGVDPGVRPGEVTPAQYLALAAV
ncbi:MAG: 16S rRNA (adenine(1518)-N(6)/adenine(1519)-N(6))-dimethyltransferase RsmA [Gammaproteobacteria bacterium]|nr:16S rRNA (adenine(1518)-N(6)/adenine(1519)-N(6))-dimethyltransferase RsmA [Gammaproteobacteria bacterium]